MYLMTNNRAHMTGTRKEWLAARLDLLKAEKELTRHSDELARRRQELPWVRIDEEYRFDTDEGRASLAGGAATTSTARAERSWMCVEFGSRQTTRGAGENEKGEDLCNS